MQSIFAIQDCSLQYAQSSFTDGMETFKSHLETSQHWLQMGDQQEALPSLMDSGIEMHKRNVALLQRTTEHGAEAFRKNVEVVRDLTQTLMKQTQDRQTLFFWW
jgi:hypothetical protein